MFEPNIHRSYASRLATRPAHLTERPRAPYLRVIETPRPLHPVLVRRDPQTIRRAYPALTMLVDRYYRAEFEGIEHLSDQACLMVSTHNGSMATPDLYCMMVAFWRRFGLETPGYGLMHRQAFRVPWLGSFLARLGALHANQENGRIALESGFPVMVCPGGDLDALKPFRDRHQVMFGNRMGFVRLAIRQQVPIVPAVSVGAHETMMILNDGRWLAEVTGAAKYFRIKTIPFGLSFPFGLTPACVGAIPLPSKIRVRVLPPIVLDERIEAADDDATVKRCAEHVRQVMQRSLDDLASQRKRIFFG